MLNPRESDMKSNFSFLHLIFRVSGFASGGVVIFTS